MLYVYYSVTEEEIHCWVLSLIDFLVCLALILVSPSHETGWIKHDQACCVGVFRRHSGKWRKLQTDEEIHETDTGKVDTTKAHFLTQVLQYISITDSRCTTVKWYLSRLSHQNLLIFYLTTVYLMSLHSLYKFRGPNKWGHNLKPSLQRFSPASLVITLKLATKLARSSPLQRLQSLHWLRFWLHRRARISKKPAVCWMQKDSSRHPSSEESGKAFATLPCNYRSCFFPDTLNRCA